MILKSQQDWLKSFQRRKKVEFRGIYFFVPSIEDIDWATTSMQDTADDIKKKQLEIWLAKPLEERLLLTLEMNDELNTFWSEVRKSISTNQVDNKTTASED